MPSIIAIDFDLTISPFSFPKEIDLNEIFDIHSNEMPSEDAKQAIGNKIRTQIDNTYDVDSYDKVQHYMTTHVKPFLESLSPFGNTKLTILTVNRAKNVLHILNHFGININTGFESDGTPIITETGWGKWRVVSVRDLGVTKVEWVLNQLTSEYNSIIFLDDSPTEQKAMQTAIDCDVTKKGRDSRLLRGRVISIPRPPRKGPFEQYGMFGERGWLYGITMVTQGTYRKFYSKVTYWQVFLQGMWADDIKTIKELNKKQASGANKTPEPTGEGDEMVPTFKTFKKICIE